MMEKVALLHPRQITPLGYSRVRTHNLTQEQLHIDLHVANAHFIPFLLLLDHRDLIETLSYALQYYSHFRAA